MTDLIEILKLAKNTLGSLLARHQAMKEKSWDEVVLALEKVNELTKLHVEAVAEVTSPILTDGDLLETSQRYYRLVNNVDFPRGYDEIRGILAAAKKLPSFNDAVIQDHIQNVINQLSNFQRAAFTLEWDSYRVNDAVKEAANIVTSHDDSSLNIAKASKPFITTFTGVFAEDMALSFKDPLTTREELVKLIQQWMQTWQRHVQHNLYGDRRTGGGGLDSAIAQLRMQRHA